MEKKERMKLLDRLFGGIDMTWPKVIIFAVATAVITAIFLIVPVFKGTSFARMGETYEAWVLFAVIIMANCKKPLESALKVFVFFLISQPLIYLLQVPFSYMGWKLFGYYPFWAMLTVATLPVAYVGWYITKKNWLSALIFAPVLAFLALYGAGGLRSCMEEFPRYLLVAVFCLAQIIVYILVFFPEKKYVKPAAIVFFTLVFLGMTFLAPDDHIVVNDYLPDTPVLSESVEYTVDDPDLVDVTVTDPAGARFDFVLKDLGTTALTVTDGGNTYRYTLEIYRDGKYDRLRITPAAD